MSFRNYRVESRDKQWGAHVDSGKNVTLDQINCGSLLRIADAVELMAQEHAKLVHDRDWYKRMYEDERNRSTRLERSNAALRGVITKMKKRAGL